MTADVQRELAEAVEAATIDYGAGKSAPDVHLFDFYAAALLPTVQALIADAEKRAAAAALTDFAALIDRGPTFPLPPSIFSAMARERADEATGR